MPNVREWYVWNRLKLYPLQQKDLGFPFHQRDSAEVACRSLLGSRDIAFLACIVIQFLEERWRICSQALHPAPVLFPSDTVVGVEAYVDLYKIWLWPQMSMRLQPLAFLSGSLSLTVVMHLPFRSSGLPVLHGKSRICLCLVVQLLIMALECWS